MWLRLLFLETVPTGGRLADAVIDCATRGLRIARPGRSAQRHRIWYKIWMHPDAANPLLPLVTLAAGVFLLIAPRIVSVAVAVYLIIAGLLGLNGIYHFFK